MRRATLLGGVLGGNHSQKLQDGSIWPLKRLSRLSHGLTTGDHTLTSIIDAGLRSFSCRNGAGWELNQGDRALQDQELAGRMLQDQAPPERQKRPSC